MENYLNQLKKKIVENISQNPNFKTLVKDLNKFSDELRQKGQDLNHYLKNEKNKTVEEARSRYSHLLKSIHLTQKNLDLEMVKAVQGLRQSAQQLEKNLQAYKKKALSQKAKLEKALKKTSRKKGPVQRKKTTSRKRSAKAN